MSAGPPLLPESIALWKGTTQAVRTQPWLWRNAYFPVRSWGLKCGTLSSLPSSLCYRLESGIHHFSIYFFLNMTSITLWKVAIIPARCHVPSFAFWNPDLVPKSMAEGKCPLAACAAFPWTKGRTQHRVTLLVTRKRPTMQGAELQLTYNVGTCKEPFQSFIFLLQSAAAVEGRFATQAHSAGRGGWASLLAIDPCLPARFAAFNSLLSSVGGLLFSMPAMHADRCPPRVICRSLRGFRPSCLHATISISLTILLPEKHICRSGSITVQTFINSPQAYTIIGRGPLTEGEDHAVVLRLCTAVMQSMMAGVEGAARGTTLPHTLC